MLQETIFTTFMKIKTFLLKRKLFKNYLRVDRNFNSDTKDKFETEKEKCQKELELQENFVILALVIESSVEAGFQLFFQTVYIFPKIIVGSFDLNELLDSEFISIYSSFFTFAWAFHTIRYTICLK